MNSKAPMPEDLVAALGTYKARLVLRWLRAEQKHIAGIPGDSPKAREVGRLYKRALGYAIADLADTIASAPLPSDHEEE